MTWRERLLDLAQAAEVTLLRLVALAYVAFTLAVWAHLLGAAVPGLRAAASGPQQAVVVALAVLCPVTAVGLWSLASWGQVIWAGAIAIHVAAVLNGWAIAIEPGALLAFHIACLTTFGAVVLARLVANKA